MYSLLSIVARTPSFKVSMSQMVYPEKNDNSSKLHGFPLLMGARKGRKGYIENNENITLIIIEQIPNKIKCLLSAEIITI